MKLFFICGRAVKPLLMRFFSCSFSNNAIFSNTEGEIDTDSDYPDSGSDVSSDASGTSSVDVADRLQSEYSILVTSRSGLLRVSPHIDNSLEDIDSLVSALGEIMS